MKYLGLVYIDEDKLKATAPDECLAYAESLKEKGQCLAAEALECCNPAAMTIRLDGGKLSATDGPYMETKEHLAGVYLLDVTDQDEAVRLAARIPAAWAGRIELRPVWEPAR